MIISLDKYKATGGGTGGNTEVVSSGGELTMKEFVEEVRRQVENNNAKYKTTYRYLVDGYIDYGSYFFKTYSIIPYLCDLDGNYYPLREAYYNNDSGSYEYIKNPYGEDANVIMNYTFLRNFQPLIDSRDYTWICGYGEEYQKVELGKLCGDYLMPKQYNYDSFWMCQRNFGYLVDDDYNFYKPFEYVINGRYNYEYNYIDGGIDCKLVKTGGDLYSNSITYADEVDSTPYDIYGAITAIPALADYCWCDLYDLSQIINKAEWYNRLVVDMFVYTGKTDIDFMTQWYVNTDEKKIPVEVNKEIAFLYDTKLSSRISATSDRSYNNIFYCCINAPTEYYLTLFDFTKKNTRYIRFKNFDKMTALNLTLEDYISGNNSINMNFQNCKNLKNIIIKGYNGPFKQSSVDYMFAGCSSLTSIPQLDTSSVTNMNSMFNGCSSLTSIPQLDTSNVTHMEVMFAGCSSLTTIPQLDCSNLKNTWHMFANCSSLTDFGGFKNLSKSITDANFWQCENLTVESMMNIINNFATVENATFAFGQKLLSKLTPEQIAVATSKGWTLT